MGNIDWAERKRQYFATNIDWERLRAYAKRVAKETRKSPVLISKSHQEIQIQEIPRLFGFFHTKSEKK